MTKGKFEMKNKEDINKLILVKYGAFNLSKEARTDKTLIEFLSSHMPNKIRHDDYECDILYHDCVTLARILLGEHMNMGHIKQELIDALEDKNKETLILMFYTNLTLVLKIEYVSCFKDKLFTIAVGEIDEYALCEYVHLITELYNN